MLRMPRGCLERIPCGKKGGAMSFTDDELLGYAGMCEPDPDHNGITRWTGIPIINKLAQALLDERKMKRVACHFGVNRSREATIWEDYAVALAEAVSNAPHDWRCKYLKICMLADERVCDCWKAAVTQLVLELVGYD
jgi:hypothetical protein